MPTPKHLALLLFLSSGAIADEPPAPFTLLFIGGAAGDEGSTTLGRLEARLKTLDPKRSRVVFTGNYSVGELPEEGQQGRVEAEQDLLAHVAATKDFVTRGGKVYYLPGYRDFGVGGTRAVLRMRKFLNAAYAAGENADVMPHANCADPTVVELTDDLGLVLLNSQWWMIDGQSDPQFNKGCVVKSREALRMYMRDAFNEYRTRRLVVAMHHPLRSYGELGGEFAAQVHFKPAPILGTVGVLAAEAGLLPQYQSHPLVYSFLSLVTQEAQRYGSFIFASGHDASLQYLKVDPHTQLISGTSARSADPTVKTDEGDFAAASPGWAELRLDSSGAGDVRFIAAEPGSEVLFEAKVPAVEPFKAAVGPPGPFPPSPVVSTYTKNGGQKLGTVSKFVLGSFYSDAFTLELPWETLDLQQEQGGLKPFKTGGSFQTNSLRMVDPQGGNWALRAVTKDSSRFLGNKPAEAGAAGGTVSHGLTAMHPEGALAVPRLAKALGILHAEPRLLYLPDQEGLGKYRGYIGNELVLLERSPREFNDGVLPAVIAGEPSTAGPTKFRTTEETLDKLLDKPAKHRVNQEEWLRARLLDILIGDWDRHTGQWRFAGIPNADGTILYRPIPRDRDQAFTNYNAFALKLARMSAQQPRQLQAFNDDYGSLEWLTYSGRNIDPILLNQLTWEQWLAVATAAKSALTDEVIDEAFSTWHRESYVLDGARVAGHVKARRDQLIEVAEEFFEKLNENVEVLGSTHDDLFELTFEDGGRVRLTVRGKKKGPIFFDRTFDPSQTDELYVYALDGDDTLKVQGTPHRKINVRFVGGEGDDVVTAAAPVKGELLRARAIKLYDSPNGARIDPSIEVGDKRSSLAHLNQYDRTENHELSQGVFVPGLAANPEDGALFGGAYTYTAQGYKKSPYASRHEVLGRFATATLGLALDYRAVFPQSADLLDQTFELGLKAPTWTRNFFGYTNQYRDEGEPLDFYRVRQAAVEGRYGVAWGFGGDRSRVGAQVVGQFFSTEATPGRFVSASPDTEGALGKQAFLGLRLFAETQTFDRLSMPTRGVGVSASIESRYDLRKGGDLSTNYKLKGSVVIPIDRARRFVLLSRAGVEGIVGEHAFFFSPTLGDTELRAYHPQQLAGDVAFSQTTDLRIDVFRSSSAVPGTIGVNLSVDHGRVFGRNITGDRYHLSLGGGVFWALMDTVAVSMGYYRGLDGGSRFTLLLGPLFAPSGF